MKKSGHDYVPDQYQNSSIIKERAAKLSGIKYISKKKALQYIDSR
jgi:hypothetical protein